ncbi:MAG: ABC transporter permease [Acidobacteriota bacterium]
MTWIERVRAAFADAVPPEDDVIEELAQHAQALSEAARARGCSEDEADQFVTDQLARWRADGAGLRPKRHRGPAVPPPSFTASLPRGLLQDLRYAVRLVLRQPRYALLTILTLAVGIGACTSLFSVTYGVLMKPLPWKDSDRIVLLTETRGGHAPRFGAFSNAAYLTWLEGPATVSYLAAWSQRVAILSGTGEPARIRITAATPSLFPLLDARPLLGALFRPGDDNAPVMVLSERLWRSRFNADREALGRLVQLDGQAYTVIGVLPDRLAYPDRDSLAWVP